MPGVRRAGQPGTARAPWWVAAILPHLVGAYVIYHVLSVIVGSVPAPYEALNREAWKNPSVQSEIESWAARVQRFGWEMTPREVEDSCYRICRRVVNWHRLAMRPFRSYQRHTGTMQSWSMFVAPHRHPSILHIDVKSGGQGWQPVYIARSDDATWRRAQFDHIRFRSAIFRFPWPQYRRPYDDFAAWIADRAAEDFPEADDVRVRFFTYTTLSPKDARAGAPPQGSFGHTRTLSLDELR